MEKTNCIVSTGANPGFRDLIYDLMNGFINLDKNPVPESQYVANEYAESKKCEQLYKEIYNTKLRLFDRLHSDDDNELNHLVDCFSEIEGILSRKMFEYGWFFAKRDMTKEMPET